MLTVSENGYGKCTPIDEYRVQARGGKGTINLKTVPKIECFRRPAGAGRERHVHLQHGQRHPDESAGNSVNHRVTQGVKLIDLAPEEKLVGVARTTSESEDKDDTNGADEANGNGEENGPACGRVKSASGTALRSPLAGVRQ